MRTQATLKFIIAIVLTFSQVLLAAPVSRVTNFSDGQVLTASQLNSEFNNVITGVNSINNAQIASNAAIDPSKLSAAIKGDAINRDGITGALSAKADDVTLEVASDSLRIKDLGVSTAKIAAGAVTQAKRAALDIQTSASSGLYTTSSNTITDVTNLSVTLTTTGRPVMLTMISATNGNGSSATDHGRVRLVGPSTEAFGQIFFDRGGSILITHGIMVTTLVTSSLAIALPCTAFSHIDAPAAGTYTYKIRANMVGTGFGNNTVNVSNCKLVAYEL
jgi:hypothetical protein